MKDRLFGILRGLMTDESGLFHKVSSVSEFDDDTFELNFVPISNEDQNRFEDHQTLVSYQTFGEPERVGLDFQHIWGWLDTTFPEDELLWQVVKGIKENTKSWHASGFYLGMRVYNGNVQLTLNSSLYVLSRWSDADISEVIGQRIFDLSTAFMTYDPALAAFHDYYESEN